MIKNNIGFVGMTHLGLNMAVGTAMKGFNVICYDKDLELIRNLKKNKLHINEPNLEKNIKKFNKNILFTSDLTQLNESEIIYISLDIETDNKGNSCLESLRSLIKSVDAEVDENIIMVLLSQVHPSFSTELNIKREFYYQVETLIFGRALERVVEPERIIVGSRNKKISEVYREFLKKFTKNIILMSLESAELAKISINCFLISNVTTTNTLSEICEQIGASWEDIAYSLKLDKRIGKYAYLKPGLGLSGGNLERDLTTIINISKKFGTYTTLFNSWLENSYYRKNWVFNILYDLVLSKIKNPTISIWGLTYKENTNSIKNSPAVDLLFKIKHHNIKIFDPVIKKIEVNSLKISSHVNLSESLFKSDVLCVMTNWDIFKTKEAIEAISKMKKIIIIDPLCVLGKDVNLHKSKHIYMGSKYD